MAGKKPNNGRWWWCRTIWYLNTLSKRTPNRKVRINCRSGINSRSDTVLVRLCTAPGICAPHVHSSICFASATLTTLEIEIVNILHFLLCPFEISLGLFCRLHALCKVRSRFCESCSRLRLQSQQFLILRVQLSRPLPMSAKAQF